MPSFQKKAWSAHQKVWHIWDEGIACQSVSCTIIFLLLVIYISKVSQLFFTRKDKWRAMEGSHDARARSKSLHMRACAHAHTPQSSIESSSKWSNSTYYIFYPSLNLSISRDAMWRLYLPLFHLHVDMEELSLGWKSFHITSKVKENGLCTLETMEDHQTLVQRY